MRGWIENLLMKSLQGMAVRNAVRIELAPKYKLSSMPELTSGEKQEVTKIWQSLGLKPDFNPWRMYKGIVGFDAQFVPDDIFVKSIIRTLNPIRNVYALQCKSLYPILFKDLNKPFVYLNCINRKMFDSCNKSLTVEDACCLLKEVKQDLICKPSVSSCSGGGIIKINFNELTISEIQDTLRGLGDNFVCQQLVRQSEVTARFNKSSLNSFRLNTVNINGKVTVENIMFRHGRGDSIIDNAGAGGICCGLNNDGSFLHDGIDANLQVYGVSPFGEQYSSIVIPQVTKLVDAAIAAHIEYIPMLGHAAWDFALDENDTPVFVEVNLGWPGIVTEQLSSRRSVFNTRTLEVVEYVRENKESMVWTDFTGGWT